MKYKVTKTAITSAATIESQMPSMPNISGNTSTAIIWKTNVRKNEISAESNTLKLTIVKARFNLHLRPSENEVQELEFDGKNVVIPVSNFEIITLKFEN